MIRLINISIYLVITCLVVLTTFSSISLISEEKIINLNNEKHEHNLKNTISNSNHESSHIEHTHRHSHSENNDEHAHKHSHSNGLNQLEYFVTYSINLKPKSSKRILNIEILYPNMIIEKVVNDILRPPIQIG